MGLKAALVTHTPLFFCIVAWLLIECNHADAGELGPPPALKLIIPGTATDVAGVVLLAVLFLWQAWERRHFLPA